jgi:hypothetical protein
MSRMMGACCHSATPVSKVQQDGDLEEGMVMRGHSSFMDYYDEEVGMIGVDGVVMNDEEDGKNRMIDMEIETNG